jgi:hypothetical protein
LVNFGELKMDPSIKQFECIKPESMDWDDARIVEASYGSTAAERFAERYDAESAEYTYAQDGGVVYVREVGATQYQAFNVQGEETINYWAQARDTASS